jgi:hypothetical protein
MIECPRCGQTLTYGDARAAALYPVIESNDEPGALLASAVVECRCGATAVDVQQRGTLLLVIPRPGKTLIGSSGADASVVL